MSELIDTSFLKVLDRKEVIVEGRDGQESKALRCVSILQEGNIININNRVYDTKSVLIPAVDDIQEQVKERAIYGELEHPKTTNINLERISHVITKIWMEGRKVLGELEVLYEDFPCGAILRGMLKNKLKSGISSRSLGEVESGIFENEEVDIVQPGLVFVTWDIVARPSVKRALLQLQESAKHHVDIAKCKKNQPTEDYNRLYQKALIKSINDMFGN